MKYTNISIRGAICALLALFVLAFSQPQMISAQGEKRKKLNIVGSSTVYPFASAVAEKFGATTRYPTPSLESTGSGGGHKLFGKGPGLDTPDITNSSRKMKISEFKRAKNNGVQKITEAVIGYDGIAVAQHAGNDAVNLTLKQITLAVAAEVPNPNGSGLIKNPYQNWSEISSDLPDRPITIYGPPTTSGTRDAFESLVMEAATENMPAYDGEYTKVRQDGPWVNSGENDNLIVKKLEKNHEAFGVFGFSFLDENRDQLQGSTINGVAPNPKTISSGKYPISRSLYFYIKNSHLKNVPGMYEYAKMFMSEDMIGPDGELKELGLIPLPDHLRKASRERVLNLDPLKLKDNGKLETLQDYASQNDFSMNN